MENLIEIQDVVKRFGEQTVLDHVSLSVTPGKIYGIIGRNGSGKTVLFKSICGFVLPDAGKILVRGKQVGRMWISHRELELLLNIRVFCGIIQAFRT